MRLWSRAGYLAATAALTVAGGLGAGALDAGSPRAVAAGLAMAWALQAPSFWRLAGAIARGERAVRDWAGGIALRLGGFGVIVAAGAATGLPTRDAAVAYVAALLAYLALEAVWLLRRQPAAAGGSAGSGTGRTGQTGDSGNEFQERAPATGPADDDRSR